MIYSKSLRYIFFAIPKTACTTIAYTLINNFDGHVLNDQHDTEVPEEYKEFFRFASIRNPYSRAVSAYRYLLDWHRNRNNYGTEMSFDWFWPKFHAVSMCDFLSSGVHAPGAVPPHLDFNSYVNKTISPGFNMHFLRVENLDEDFSKLPFVNQPYQLSRENQSKYQGEVPMKTIMDYVANHYVEDFVRFDYKIDN